MDEKKQIEEMARDIFASGVAIDGIDLAFASVYGADKEDTHFMRIAKHLYNAGYRKQSESVIELPCKVGDTLYVISQTKDKRFLPFIKEYEVTSISIKKKRIVIYHEMDGYIKTFKEIDFGKTVFLSKAEAERVVTDNNDGVK